MAKYSTNGSSALAPNDPYQEMDRPNFRVINGGKSNNPTSTRPDLKVVEGKKSNSSQNSAKDLLRRSENSSLSPSSSDQNSWQNNVQGKAPVTPGPGSHKITIKNKKGTAVIGIVVGILIIVAAFLGSTNSLLPGAINALFTMNSNSSYAGYVLRSAHIQQYVLKNLGIKSSRKGLARFDSISDTLSANLARNNITIDGTGENTVLKFSQVDSDGIIKTKTITGDTFFDEYMSDAKFREAYNNAKHSKVITAFDDSADDYFNKTGNSRNTLKNFRETGDTDVDTAEYNKIRADRLSSDQTATNIRGVKDEYEYDTYEDGSIKYNDDGEPIIKYNDDGKPVIKQSIDNETAVKSTSNGSLSDANARATTFIDDFATKANIAGQLLNGGCALYKITSALALTITALTKTQNSKLASSLLESVSKAVVGEGDSSGINIAMNFLATSVTTTTTDFSTLKVDGIETENPTSSIATMDVSGSPLQSQGFQKNLANATVDKTKAANYSSNRITSSLSSALNMTVNSIHTCTAIQAGAAVISIAVTIGSFGTSTLVSIAGKFFLSAGIGITVTAFLKFLIPTVGQLIVSNAAETLVGIPAGENIASGVSYLEFSLGRSASGQVPATKEAVLEYNNTTVKKVAALDAEIDRNTLSPFDTSSPNTFLGSIAYSLLGVSISSGATSSINTILRTTSKAISTITGSASADGEDSTYMTTFGECSADMLALGYDACDMYGEPIRISTLIDIEPDDETYLSVIESQLNEDGSIIDGSDLANFIIANMESVTDPGVVNTEVLQANDKGNVIVNAVPLVGDAFDIYNAAMEEKNVAWATCEYCGASPSNDLWDSEIKYFQRYVEDQRILDQISGDASANPVTAFRKKYETEHPIDDSYAGYIAHITGLPKSTAESVIALVEYYQFIDNYDTSTRIAMIEKNTTVQSSESVIARFDSTRFNLSPKSNSDPTIETETLLAKQSEQYIIYADVRNRSYAA